MEHMYEPKDAEAIIPPSPIYYKKIIRESIKKTIRTAGSPGRLWPHVEGHKSVDIVRVQMEYDITRFKTAAVAEAEIAIMAGTERVILAYPLVGPSTGRFVKLTKAYPDTIFYGVEGNRAQFEALFRVRVEHDTVLPMPMDIGMGMNRTGVPTRGLEELYRFAYSFPGLRLCGMHCYDGNHNNKDAAVRWAEVDDTDRKMADIMERLTGDGACCELAVTGGTPSFPCRAGCTRWYLPPGTAFIADVGYYADLPDLDFTSGTAVMTRVISHPTEGVFTVDLGYKAIVSDPAGQRGFIVGLEGTVLVIRSEERQAFRLKGKSRIPTIGTCLYVIPTHICSTTALYPEIPVAREGRVAARWQATARNRRITY